MEDIRDILSNIKNLLISEELKKGIIQDAIFQIVGIKIDIKDVKIKNKIVYLDMKPIYKNEIFLKKENVLLFLEERRGKNKILDIR